MVLVANKNDLFDQEEVNENEAKEYAKEIGAIFKVTSAFTGIGIDELFKSIGCKILETDNKNKAKNKEKNENNNNDGNDIKDSPKNENIKLEANKAKGENKQKCCYYF